MPIHIAPYFRNKELAEEAAGLIVKLDSVGYTTLVNEENAGLRPKNIVREGTFYINGTTMKFKE